MKTFVSVWAAMEEKLLSAKASEGEVEKLRIIFYTGAVTLLELQLSAYKNSNGDAEKGAKDLRDITLELTKFMQGLAES